MKTIERVLCVSRSVLEGGRPDRAPGRRALGAVCLVGAILAARAGETVVRFAYQDRLADALSIIAVNEGFFTDEALKVKGMRFSSGPSCSEALYTGAADIGTMGDATAVVALARNAPVVLLASHGAGENRHRIIVRPDRGIKTPADLIGKRIAVKRGTSTYGGFLAFLKKHGLDVTRLNVVDMRPSDMPTALAAGSIDALVASEPTPSLAEQHGGRPLATLGGMGNTYPILLLARKRFLAGYRDETVRFLRAMMRAERFLREHPDEAVKIVAKQTSLPPEVTRRAMGFHTYHVNLDETTLRSLLQTAEFLKGEGVIRRVPTIEATAARALMEKASDGLK